MYVVGCYYVVFFVIVIFVYVGGLEVGKDLSEVLRIGLKFFLLLVDGLVVFLCWMFFERW